MSDCAACSGLLVPDPWDGGQQCSNCGKPGQPVTLPEDVLLELRKGRLVPNRRMGPQPAQSHLSLEVEL